MDYKVNYYVRTKYGIAQIINILNTQRLDLRTGETYNDKEYELDKFIIPGYDVPDNRCDESDIIKARPNILDLIEEFDIIEFNNGIVLRVESINDKYICFHSQDNDCAGIFFNRETLIKDIKSIVTKEQFESRRYRIGGMHEI